MRLKGLFPAPPRGRAIPAAMLALFVLTAATAARGQTVTVSTCDEAHLRNALNTVPAGGTVNFSCGEEITLTSGTPLTITQAVTIDGTGQSLFISGGGTTQVFVLQGSGAAPAVRKAALNKPRPKDESVGCQGFCVNFLNLTITNGFTATGNGGGISINSANVTLTNVTLSSNKAVFGGAVYNNAGVIYSIANSTFNDNSASAGGSGGALFNLGVIYSVTNTTFSNNIAANGIPAATGGAIGNGQYIGSISNCTFSLNSSAGEGGAIINGATMVISNTTFIDNSASGQGGAISTGALAQPTTISNSSFIDNQSFFPGQNPGGGAIFNSGADFTVDSSTFVGNSATGAGGAIAVVDLGFGTGVINNSTFSSNHSSWVGGAIYNSGEFGANYLTLSNNSAADGAANVYNDVGGLISLATTIFASGDCINHAGGTLDGDHNLDSGASCTIAAGMSNLQNTNPQVGGLANNGGPTETIALAPTSPAIGQIPPGVDGCGTTFPTDQRGVTRPQQPAGCDIGAYELIVATSGDEIEGTVTDSHGNVVSAAPVQVCPTSGGSCPFTELTNGSGGYMATGLMDGSFLITVFPPAGSDLFPAAITVTASGVPVTNANLQLGVPAPAPAGSGFTPNLGLINGVQVVNWNTPTTLSTTGCPNGSATYTIATPFGMVISQGALTETPAGSGDYAVALPPLNPNYGGMTVTIGITCPGNGMPVTTSFSLYIDPDGVVKDQFGVPVAGATVTLLSAPSLNGAYTPVPAGNPIMSPANQTNPTSTNATGNFGWDVIAGFYQVQATAPGCNVVTSAPLTVPPAVTGVELDLTCVTTGTAPVSGSTCNGVYTGQFNGNLTVSGNQSCKFEGAGSGVSGNLRVTGGSLTLAGATVNGNVQIGGDSSFAILPGTTVRGNLQIQNIPASGVVNQICGATVDGNLQFQSNASAVQIGSAVSSCPGNTVKGNLQVQNNTAQTLVFDNQVRGNLQDQNNTTAPPVVPATEVIGNVVSGNLQCQNDSSIIGGPNTASHNVQGGCK